MSDAKPNLSRRRFLGRTSQAAIAAAIGTDRDPFAAQIVDVGKVRFRSVKNPQRLKVKAPQCD